MTSSNNTYDEPDAHRELVHEQLYYESVEQIFSGNVPRADEALRGLETWISRRPELCMAVHGREANRFGQWLSKRIPPSGFRVQVVFEFDENTVWLLGARIAPEPDEGQF